MAEIVRIRIMEIRGLSGSGASAATVQSCQSRDPANPDSDKQLRIPLPPLATQQAIVAEIEAEQALVSANRELAQRMEARIAAAIGRVWAE